MLKAGFLTPPTRSYRHVSYTFYTCALVFPITVQLLYPCVYLLRPSTVRFKLSIFRSITQARPRYSNICLVMHLSRYQPEQTLTLVVLKSVNDCEWLLKYNSYSYKIFGGISDSISARRVHCFVSRSLD